MTGYEDFDLQITPVEKVYLASAVAPQAKLDGQTRVKPPLIEAGWPEVFEVLAEGMRQVTGQPRAAGDGRVGAERVGSTLFDRVFRGEVLSVFERSLGHAQGQGGGLRLRLHLSLAPELACLPWELLRYNGRFLAKSSETPIVRCPDLEGSARPRVASPPVRLLLVAPRPEGQQELQGQKEVARIEGALAPLVRKGRVHIETLFEGASRGELRRRLHDRQRPVHALHFIGHGTFETLVFEGPERRADRVAASHLSALLPERSSLCLAVINACEGGAGDPGKRHTGLAQILVRSIPGVVAMQARISDLAALSFAGHFYEALAEGLSLEEVMSKARLGVLSDGHDAEWAIPVLYSRSAENPLSAHRPAAAHRSVPPEPLSIEGGPLRRAAETARAAGRKLAPLAPLARAAAAIPPLAWMARRKRTVLAGLALGAALGAALFALRPGGPDGPGASAVNGSAGREVERGKTCGFSRAFPRMRFVRIPPDSDPEGESPEPLPEGFSPFCLGAFEVTRGDVAEIDQLAPAERPRLPAQGISRQRAEELAQSATRRDPAFSYRLPTEGEWRYAAGAGSRGGYGVLHYAGSAGRNETCSNGTGPVEVERSGWNAWGVYGTDGNVSEWVQDSVPARGSPQDPAQHTQGVFLGGNWSLKASCRPAVYRDTVQPGYVKPYLGFRLVREPKRGPGAR